MLAKSLTALIFVTVLAAPALAQDAVIDFATDDPEMNAAIDKARATLPDFWARFAAPGPNESDFSLKLGISDGVNTEHFWCGSIQGDAESATCIIDNQPVHVQTVAYGEEVEVDPAIISDWLYYRDDKIVGGETIRVMIPRMDKKAAAATLARMAEP